MNYTLWIVYPNESYTHSQAFTEVAEALQAAFKELGHGCDVVKKHPIMHGVRGNVIILGAHLLHPDDLLYLDAPVVWQLEQMPGEGDVRDGQPLTANYLEILKQVEVWDYSRVNVETLAKLRIEAKLLEIGYMPCLTKIENVVEPDIDLLFIGSMNQRRAHILQGVQAAGKKVVHAFDCYGVKRDALIARAKVVANIHYYEAKIFEIARCSYLMANRKAVVSEVGLDKQLEEPYFLGRSIMDVAIQFMPYEGVVDRCLSLLKNDEWRERTAQKGFEVFKQRSQAEFLRDIL